MNSDLKKILNRASCLAIISSSLLAMYGYIFFLMEYGSDFLDSAPPSETAEALISRPIFWLVIFLVITHAPLRFLSRERRLVGAMDISLVLIFLPVIAAFFAALASIFLKNTLSYLIPVISCLVFLAVYAWNYKKIVQIFQSQEAKAGNKAKSE